MGPIRGRLITALMCSLPGVAFADVCRSQRPEWNGQPVTIWGEALALFSSPAALFLLAASAVAVALRSQSGALVVCVLWSFLALGIISFDPKTRALAVNEGCVGSPILFIEVIALLSGAMIVYTSRRVQKG
ncbi:MAG: hypothetical protein R3210_04880 [Roseovarius sp.]|nr:hypothetical protein [Roseovarius sp.]